MRYALIHFISWPLLIWLSYILIRLAVNKYEKRLDENEEAKD